MLGLSALNFDLSVYDIFGLLAAGGALVLPDAGASRDPETWATLVAAERVTVWNSVPAIVALLLDEARCDGAAALAALRLVMMSGDRIPPSLPAVAAAPKADVQLVRRRADGDDGVEHLVSDRHPGARSPEHPLRPSERQ